MHEKSHAHVCMHTDFLDIAITLSKKNFQCDTDNCVNLWILL